MTEKELLEIEIPKLEDFLTLCHPERFDFRNLMKGYYEHYKDLHEGSQEYEELLKELPGMRTGNPAEKWFLYRELGVGKKYKGCGRPFDCDNSNTTCQLTAEIYEKLWSEEILAFCKQMGTPVGETVNSVLTTLNELAISERLGKRWSWEEWKKLYHADKDHKEFKQFFVAHPQVQDFIQVAHTIGNFLPWPVGCNAPRGMSPQIKDYWDLTLDCIYWWYQKNKQWLQEGPWFPQNDMIVGLFDSQMVNFDQYLAAFGSWNNFVKANYMQPFVYTIDGRDVPENWPGPFGRPKELWEGHLAKATPVLPAGDEIFKYFENATKWIQDRSALMVDALLKKKEDK